METRRYLARMDTRELGHLYTDCLIIGGGVAGLRAALEAADAGSVLVLVKDKLIESNTYHAQGGIAVVQEEDDTFESHISDTLDTGCGLCNKKVVELVVRGGPAQLEQLRKWSAPFDMDGSKIAVGREGGHKQARVVHALGDATGRAVSECLTEQVRNNTAIKIFENCFCIDLLTEDGTCLGVLCHHPKHGLQCIWALGGKLPPNVVFTHSASM